MKLQFLGENIDLTKDGTAYGIQTLKSVSLSLAKVWPDIYKRASDGKFSFWDVLFTGVDISKAGGEIALKFRDLKNEVTDLSQDEAEDLAHFLTQNLGISNEKAELFIDKILIATITLIYTGLEVYHAVEEFVK